MIVFEKNILRYKKKLFKFDEKISNVSFKKKLIVLLETKIFVYSKYGSYYSIFNTEKSLEKRKVIMNYGIFIETGNKIHIIKDFILGKEFLVNGELITTCKNYILFKFNNIYFLLNYKKNLVYALTIDLDGFRVEGYRNNLLIIDSNRVVIINIKNSISVKEVGCRECITNSLNLECTNKKCIKNRKIESRIERNRNSFVKVNDTQLKKFKFGYEFISIGNVLILDNKIITQKYDGRKFYWFVKYLSRESMAKYLAYFYSGVCEIKLILSMEIEISKIFERKFLESKNKKRFIEENKDIIENLAIKGRTSIFKTLQCFNTLDEYDMRRKYRICIESTEFNPECLDDFEYKRLFYYNENFLSLDNRAYQILNVIKNFAYKRKMTKKLKRAINKYYRDSRIEDMFNFLDVDKVGSLCHDVVDPKQSRENSYMYRRIGIIGHGYFYFGCKRTPIAELQEIKLKRRNTIEVLEQQKAWKNYPSIHYNIVNFLSSPLNKKVTFEYLKSKMEEPAPFCGMSFALGLQGKLKRPEFIDLLDSSSEYSIGIMLGIAISYRGSDDQMLISHIKEMFVCDTPITLKPIAALSLGFLSLGNPTSFTNSLIKEQLLKEGNYSSEEHNKGNRIWYDDIYRIVCTLGLSLLYIQDYTIPSAEIKKKESFKKEFIEIEDSLSELLLNGIIFFNSKEEKIIPKLRRSMDSKPEEIYYSALFLNCINFDKDINEIIENTAKIQADASLAQKYKLSGELMYVALYFLKNKNECRNNKCLNEKCVLGNDSIKKRLLSIAMIKEKTDKFIFINILLCLAIMYNGTSDIDIMKYARQKIVEYEDTDFLHTRKEFSCGRFETIYCYYPDLIKYHQIIGLLSPGGGFYELEFNHLLIFNIVSSFYIAYPITALDQEYFQLLRYLIILNFRSNKYIKYSNKAKVYSCVRECKYKSYNNSSSENSTNKSINSHTTDTSSYNTKPSTITYHENTENTTDFNREYKILNGFKIVEDIILTHCYIRNMMPRCGIERKIIVDIISDYYEKTKEKRLMAIGEILRYYL